MLNVLDNAEHFYIVDSYFLTNNNTKGRYCCVFNLKMCTRTHRNVTQYVIYLGFVRTEMKLKRNIMCHDFVYEKHQCISAEMKSVFVASLGRSDMTFSTGNFDSVPGIFTCYCGRVSFLANVSRAILNLLRGFVSRTMTFSRNELQFGFKSRSCLFNDMELRFIVA